MVKSLRHVGGMAERSKATVLKTVVGVKLYRGFESHSLRQVIGGEREPRTINMGRCQSG